MRPLLLGAVLVPLLASCTAECTLVGCESRLEVQLEHSLNLSEGSYRLEITTPLQSLRCSFGPEATGANTCFGYRFTDLTWNEERVTVSLIDPFYDMATNPDGEPFESVDVVLFRGMDRVAELTVDIAPGPPDQPNGDGCPPTCWTARGQATLP
ncbi:MAG: hypothetical protein AB8I08_12245 [Sandaracinaceae bacterium]